MEERKFEKLCVACNRMQSLSQASCECGHVMKDAVSMRADNTRKRRAPYRANSVSSEWIGHHTQTTVSIKKKKQFDDETDGINNVNTFIKSKKIKKRKQKQRRHKQKSLFAEQQCMDTLPTVNDEKRNEIKEMLNLIENSYKNIYFDRCKSYRKMKITDFDFEFDFTTFDSHAPFYPTALEDINSKINRTKVFYKIISE